MRKRIKRTDDYEITIGQAYQDFMVEKEAMNLSVPSLKNYEQTITLFKRFNELTDDTPITDITQQHIYKWINTLRLEGLRPTSINHYLSDIRCFLYWCMAEERKYLNRFKIELVKHQEESFKMFSDEELLALLERPKKNDNYATWRSWAVVNWVLGTGNRAATIVNVKIGDINYNRKEITLRHTKNKKASIVPLSSSLESVIKEFVRMWRRDATEDDYLFANISDEQLTTDALRQSFTVFCKDREVSRHNIHGLRHNFAKEWVQNNGNMFALQKVLGHSTLDMTRRYVRLFSEDIKEDYDKFSALDNIKRNSKRKQKVKRND